MNGIARGRSFVPGVVVLFLSLAASTVSAQSAINGVVRDASGAVMPGVTVEASSDVLIEKTRTVTTDLRALRIRHVDDWRGPGYGHRFFEGG